MPSSSLSIHKCLNKCFLVDCSSTTFSALELRARATSTAQIYEERPCILTSSDTFLEHGLSPRGLSASFILWYAKPLAILQSGGRESTMDWESEIWSQLQLHPQLAAQLWTSPLSSPGLTLQRASQHQGSPWPASSIFGSADVFCCECEGMNTPRSSWEAPGALPPGPWSAGLGHDDTALPAVTRQCVSISR